MKSPGKTLRAWGKVTTGHSGKKGRAGGDELESGRETVKEGCGWHAGARSESFKRNKARLVLRPVVPAAA